MDQVAQAFSVVDLLLTVGYIDGLLHADERAFIRGYLERLVEHVAEPGTAETWRAKFDQAFAKFDAELAAIVAEVVAAGDDRYVATRLKVRAVALFRAIPDAEQAPALQLLEVVMRADGTVSRAESELHDELLTYFHAPPPPVAPSANAPIAPLEIAPLTTLEPKTLGHPLLDSLEQNYATDPAALNAQLTGDYTLIFQAITAWERHRARGNGRLAGVTDVGQIPPGTRLLDGHVHVFRPDHPVELVVLGDLHGCYACLKAALLQSDFIDRARRHQQDPLNHPDVKLVLLGDYIDRGRFSFEGVLRAALQLFVALPDHVILLRGNHEYLVRLDGRIVSAVNPAEAVPSITGRVPLDLLDAYRHLFDHMPTSFVFDRTLFVHGGIPRDETIAERYHDLSSLDDGVIRFEMMWSDPVATDVVPIELQRASPRFNFGHEQFRAFMDRLGCQTLIRGHEKVIAGFETPFALDHHRLHTLFSAGGAENLDLPVDSSYRAVTPMALTIVSGPGPAAATPWPIAYRAFNDAAHNGLYR